MERIKLKLPEADLAGFSYKTIIDIESENPIYNAVNEKYRLAGFTKENTTYQICYPTIPDYVQFAATLFDRCTLSIIKQLPGKTMPRHADTFGKASYDFHINRKDCVRVNIFLEDWKSGHYFEINDNPIVPWKRGDAVIIEKDEPHLSANNGMEPKFTMQVTGPKSELKLC